MVKAPAQYGMSIQTLATYLVEGQTVPYARASHFLQELLGVQLSAGSIASFVKTCHQRLAEVETQIKAAPAKQRCSTRMKPDCESGRRDGESTFARQIDSPTTRLIQTEDVSPLMLLALRLSFAAPVSMMDY